MPEIEHETIDYLNQALDRFDEALAIPLTNPLAIDGTIQRFEFSFELAWKAIKSVAKHFGADKKSPRDAIKAAYGYGWIDDEMLWIDILHDRNLSSHTYREDIALAVYNRLKLYASAMRQLAVSLNRALEEDIGS
jgi:nucleotidyltransferase substrate binding protein (TIGR01987 family)